MQTYIMDFLFSRMSKLIRCCMSNQVENFNEPSLLSLQDFDDAADLRHYNFDADNLTVPVDAANKKKLAYRHRFVGELYEKVRKLLPMHALPCF